MQSQFRRGAGAAKPVKSAGSGRKIRKEDTEGEATEFRVGDTVMLRKFGLGQIVEVSGTPGDEEAVIDFGDKGTKRVVLAYAPLVRL